jgi:hypothetical protein
MIEHSKEDAYDLVSQQLALCTVENATHSAVVIIVDEEKDTVKVYGLNMDEMELPMLLIEAAAEVGEKIDKLIKNRTLQ